MAEVVPQDPAGNRDGRLRIAFLTTDNRQAHRAYHLEQPYFGTAPEALLQGFAQLKDEVEVHVIGCTQRPMKSPAQLAGNIAFHSLHVPRLGWMRTGYQGCVRAVGRLLREVQPDLVHGQGTERECTVSAVFSGFPSVSTLHGNMRLIARVYRSRPFSFYWLAARLEAFTLPRADGVVCITDYTRRAVTALNPRTVVLPNAVDERFFRVLPVQRTHRKVVLCVGNICYRKNQVALIDALAGEPSRSGLILRFLGQNEASSYGGEFLDRVNRHDWCEFPGFVDRDGLARELSEASLLVLPSHEDNCPMVVLEAMAAGVPVAASRVGGVPELIQEGVTGTLMDPSDPESIRTAVLSPLSRGDDALAMARAAKMEARKRFSPEVIARAHLDFYRSVLEERASRTSR